jgi:photosystem II stability/assembly factor-like uncharacterized protein
MLGEEMINKVEKGWGLLAVVIGVSIFLLIAGTSTPLAISAEKSNGGIGEPYKIDYFDNFYGISSAGSSAFWIVGASGRILHSSDGGKNWWVQKSKTEENLNSVSFINQIIGWACGNAGTVLHTSDGGSTWTQQETQTKQPIFKIQFINEKIGFACGYYGFFIRTIDGGRTWENKSVGEDITLRGMYFFNERAGFIVGEFGAILKTENGGATFTKINSPVSVTLFCVHFSNSREGYASGIDGAILATSDGGKIWRKEESGIKDHLIGIASNERLAIAVGLRGRVVKKEKGERWMPLDLKSLNWLSGIQLGSDSQGYIVGAHGTILSLKEIYEKRRDK